MKRFAILAGTAACVLALSACNGVSQEGATLDGGSVQRESASAQAEEEPSQQPVVVKNSPDKYTWYIKNYAGMNAASVGYTALDGSRRDSYGAGTVRIVFKTADGSYVDCASEEQLQEYRVIAQDLAPNTELKYTFSVDENGEEYDNLVNGQNYDEVVLAVSKVGSNEPAPELTVIQSSPDRYTRYVKDYVGRNLATCGYYSLGGTYNDHYGQGYVKFDIVPDDGSYIDPEDTAALSQYVVTSQSVEPNTAIQMTFMTDSEGKEYDNLVQTQSLESITLAVSKVPSE